MQRVQKEVVTARLALMHMAASDIVRSSVYTVSYPETQNDGESRLKMLRFAQHDLRVVCGTPD